jgi:hypothetical protein
VKLLHLTAVGPDVPPASLEFARRLTVVYGASETGKTYVIDALNFMFGARTLRQVPENARYQRMLLGIEFDDGEVVTLSRSLRGGRIEVFDGDLRSLPAHASGRQLQGQHNRDNHENISYFLLDRLGIADSQIRTNQRNSLQAMSFRQIAHLILVDEERMQTKLSVIESGVPSTRTAERSALKLLLQGEDDSGLTQGEDPTEFRRVNAAQLSMLDRVVGQLAAQLEDAPALAECYDVLARVNASIQEASRAIGNELAGRDDLVTQRTALQAEVDHQQALGVEQATLLHRFQLLDAQYAADLDRLQLVKSAGTLLGYFDADRCVFCGAETEHQHREHAEYETDRLAESVDAEAGRTQALKHDLGQTLVAVRTELELAQYRLTQLDAAVQDRATQIARFDVALRPSQADLDELIARRSQVERWIGLWTRVAEIEGLRTSVSREQPVKADPVTDGFAVATQTAFSQTLKRILQTWKVPGADDAVFTFTGPPDIVIEGRRRDTRGKGMRSVLHAGFAVALSEFCLSGDLPHPGFVALDTPVLTYRDADDAAREHEDDDDEFVSGSVAEAFYRYLATEHVGQVIVLENQTPPDVDEEDCLVVHFSGNAASGRAGFYPAPETDG